MEYFDIVDEAGEPTGKTVSRKEAHEQGILHRTAHVWIVRQSNGKTEILLQKRSAEKDSFPGMYDTSSAGHIPAGEESLPSALRELQEELGVIAAPEDLSYAGTFHIQYEQVFHGRLFRDNEVTKVFVYVKPVERFTLQKSEVSEVRWFDMDEVWNEICFGDRHRFCVPKEGLNVLRTWLAEASESSFHRDIV